MNYRYDADSDLTMLHLPNESNEHDETLNLTKE